MSEEKKTPAKKAQPGKAEKILNWFKTLPQRIVKPFRNMYYELKKVTWPSKERLISFCIIVLLFMLFMGVVIGLLDLGASAGVRSLISATSGTTETTPVEETAEDVAEEAADAAEEAADAAADTAEKAADAVEETAEAAKETAEEAADAVKDAATDAADAAEKTAEEAAETVKDAAGEAAETAEKAVEEAAGTTEGK